MGRNPRFMQDPQSDQGAVAEMHQAIREGRATVVEVINIRKDGSRFWNQVSSLPMHTSIGTVRSEHKSDLEAACHVL